MNEDQRTALVALTALAMIEPGENVTEGLLSAVKVGEGVSFLQEWTYLIGLLPDRAISVLVKEYKTRLHAMSQLHGGPAVSLDELDIICEGLRTRRDPESTLH